MSEKNDAPNARRREFLTRTSKAAMAVGLAAGYGGFGAIAGRFLYPTTPEERVWQFVTEADRMNVGDSLLYQAPAGQTINVTRRGRGGGPDDFIALSSTCPHLGCHVHWEAQNNRYFCPCHNGTFDPAGVATGGPPGDAGQSLARYPLRIEDGLLYIEVPAARLVTERSRTPAADIAVGERRGAQRQALAEGRLNSARSKKPERRRG